MKRLLWIFVGIVVCFLVGYTASLFQAVSLELWYPFLVKPVLTPPNWVFPIVWGIIYVCMGLSVGFLSDVHSAYRNPLLVIFILQLVLNFMWSFNFFFLESPFFGMVNILLLDVLVLFYIILSYPFRKVSSLLFIPYFLWLLFATYLNGYIFVYN